MRAVDAQWSVLPPLTGPAKSMLVEILVHGPTSRASLARGSGLSPASLSRITKTMIDAGLLVETQATPTVGTGRPSLPLEVDVDLIHLIGVNLTATTLTLVRTDLRARVLDELTVDLASRDPESVADLIAAHVGNQVRKDGTVRAIGVSLAGPVSPGSASVRSSGFLRWSAVPFTGMVQRRTGLPTVVENDVRALTAAEHWFGAAAGCSDFALITIGAGIGCGIVVDNKLVEGKDGGSGHIGHLPVTARGPLCERGHRGCARAYLASTAIVDSVRARLDRPGLRYSDVLALAADGQPVARRVVQDAGRALGILVGTIAAVTAPQKILLSGEGVELYRLVADLVEDTARDIQHWSVAAVPIQIAPFTSTEWARGAAVIALRRHIEAQTDAEPSATPPRPS